MGPPKMVGEPTRLTLFARCCAFIFQKKLIFYLINGFIALFNFTPAVRYNQWAHHRSTLSVSSGVQMCFVACFAVSIPLILDFCLDTAIFLRNYNKNNDLLTEPRVAHSLVVGSLLFSAAEAFQRPSRQYSYDFLFCLISSGQTVCVIGVFGKLLEFGKERWNSFNATFLTCLFTVSQLFMSRHVIICTTLDPERCAYDGMFVLIMIANVVTIAVFCYFAWGSLREFLKLGTENLFSTNQYSSVVLTTTLLAFLVIKLFITIQFIGSDYVTNILFENIVLFGLLVILSTILPGRTIRRGLVALKKEIEYKKTFVRYISHEIRSPLSTTTLGLDYLIEQVGQGTLSPEELLDVLKDAKTSCEIATNTLNDLLMFDKIEANMLEIEPTVMFVYEFISDCVRPFKIQANSMNISIDITTGSLEKIRSGYCKLDKHKMQQVVRNFMTNAIKFTPEQGTITIDLSLTSSYTQNPSNNPVGAMGVVRVSVQDTGPGISKENLPKLFGQYVQIDAKKLQGGKGSGLGLWLSKSIVEMHGGYMGVTSEGEGHGCNFYFEVPCYSAEEVLDPSSGSCTVSEQERDIRVRQSSVLMPFYPDDHDHDGDGDDGNPSPRDDVLEFETHEGAGNVAAAAAMWGGAIRNSSSQTGRFTDASASTRNMYPPTSASHKYAAASMRPTPKTNTSSESFEVVGVDENGDMQEDSPPMPADGESVRQLSLNMLSAKSQHVALTSAGLFGKAKVVPTNTIPIRKHVLQSSASSNRSSVALSAGGSVIIPNFADGPQMMRGTFERAMSGLSAISGISGVASKKGTGGKIRLLIADDAVISRKMVERALSAVCSVCHHANNGLEAVNKTKISMKDEMPYDVILIDYYMPIMTGAEAVLHIRKEGFKGIIMAVTGSTSKDDTSLFTKNGANCVLIKPLNLQNFRKALVVAQNQQRLQRQQEIQQQHMALHGNSPIPAPLLTVSESEKSLGNSPSTKRSSKHMFGAIMAGGDG